MVERVQLEIQSGGHALSTPLERYAVLARLRTSCAKQGVLLLAFGLGHSEFRFVLDGEPRSVSQVVRGTRVGTCASVRSSGVCLIFRDTVRVLCENVETSVIWAHRIALLDGATTPLASPWTSHRDLMGYRRAAFFDADAIQGRVDRARVHRALGGRRLPRERKSPPHRPSVRLLLRLCAAVQGLLPSDRRTFGLFTHVARACGWGTMEVAAALMLTERRIRQLANQEVFLFDTALLSLQDPRLCVVP